MAFGNRRLKEVTQLFGIQLLAFAQHHQCEGPLAPALVRHPNHGDITHRLVTADQPFKGEDDSHSPPVLITS